MTIVRFAKICDKCGSRSPEYSGWATCRECIEDVCYQCDVPDKRNDEAGITTCKECNE